MRSPCQVCSAGQRWRQKNRCGKDDAEAAVAHALKDEYRLIDTANAYVNEKAVGRAIKKSGVDRGEIFWETKLWPSFYEQEDAALMREPVFAALGEKYKKSPAQIILRWHIQDGNIVIPGSKNPDHIRDNFNLFDFALTEEEMAKIDSLDQNKRYYTNTPELLEQYVTMVPPVDEQK